MLAALMEDKIKPRHIKPFHSNCNAIVFSLANFLHTLKASLILDVIISSCLLCHCLDLVKIDVISYLYKTNSTSSVMGTE